MTSKAVEFLRGKVYWFKMLPDQLTPNFAKDGMEWTMEFEPNAESVAILKKHKLTDRLKDKHEDRGPYITLKQKELDYKGERAKPVRVLNANNDVWPQATRIGNGSEVDVKVDIRDYGTGKKKGIYPSAVRILNHVAYESNEFAPLAEDDPYFGAAKASDEAFRKDFGLSEEPELDDDIPV